MLEIVVETERGERYVRVSVQELAELVRRIGTDGDRFLVVQRTPELPGVFAQVWHETGGNYGLEHREGSADRHFHTLVERPDTVLAVLVGWARRTPSWDAGLGWAPLDLGLDPAPDAAPSPAPAPALDLDDDDRVALEKHVREMLAGGYLDHDQLVEVAEDYLVTDGRRPVSPEQAQALVERLWRERLVEESTWQGETDPERLTRAFTALKAAGITARENFACCRNCGNAEIGGERAPGSHGYVYFHSQSTEQAVSGGGLMLYYGGFDGTDETARRVGREVVTVLDSVGLPTVWDGDPGRAVHITPLDWRRRLVH